ncbi:phage head spike fiber domain-containing protein [Acidovorax cavernicola]|uniref:Uncharacterized protein n=1 Tax=Acidovorax cavernicola TaxID=1675792 RepID=A0A9X8D576_9BURK|nr:hypothetical protein [Acidovorax cavernicola]RIX80199.1 hypothetical protein D3H34_12700 [Acidovorax cavernicola]
MTTTLTEKTFDELFTYAGGTNGSRVNPQGFIEPCATPRFDFDPITKVAKGLLIENARINQLAFSSRFENPVWGKAGVSVMPGAAQAPNGRWDACKLTLNNGAPSGNSYLSQTITKTAAATTFAYTFYAKAAGASNGWIYARNAAQTSSVSISFNLASMATGGNNGVGDFALISKSVNDIGNGWRRVEIVFTSDASTSVFAQIFPGTASGSGPGDGAAGLYIWGAQLEVGAFASSYIPSADAVTARASIGSYYDSKGILRYAAAGVARNSYEPSNLPLPPVLIAEEQRANILLKSNDMHLAPWTTSAGIIRTPGRLAPDGTLRAVEFSGASTGPFTQTATATATVMTYSIYVKNVSRTGNIELLLRNSTTAVNGLYGIVTLHGSTPSISGAGWEMRDVGGGWFRCIHTSAIPIAIGDILTVYAVVAGARADAGACLTWGAQLEAGAYATSYIPSTETFTGRASIGTYFDSTGAMKVAASGAARMTYNPADLSIAPWLMQEGQSTNMLLESEYRNGVTGENVGPGVSASTMAPFSGALRFQANASTAYAYKLPALQVSTTYTLSVIVEMEDGIAPSFGSDNPTPNGANTFHLVIANSQIGPLTYRVQPLGASRWRVSGTKTTPASIAQGYVGIWKYNTNDSRAFKVTAIQLEQAPFESSYITTTTATVTRLADTVISTATTRQADTASSAATTRAGDIVRIDATKGWCNSAEGTFHLEFDVPQGPNAGFQALLEIGDNTPANRVGISAGATNLVAYQYANGPQGPSTAAKSYGVAVGSVVKASLSYGVDGIRLGLGGTALAKVAAVALPSLMKFVGIGTTQVHGASQPYFHVRAVRYRPQKLTDAEVVALTA